MRPALDCALLAGLLLLPSRAADSPLSQVLDPIRAEVQPRKAMAHVRRVWSSDRWFTFPKFHETARYIGAELRKAGLKNVEILEAPADGVTRTGFWTMPIAWDVRSARLEIVEPEVAAGQKILADYRRTPSSLCMWSGPAPKAGVTAELTEAAGDYAGKFVLTSRNPANMKSQLIAGRAAGVVNGFSENPKLVHDRQWINAWGDRGWAFQRGDTPLPCFSITPAQYGFVRGLLQRGKVKIRAVVDSRYYPGTYPYVTGVIPGVSQPEEVLTLGHMAEQGAHDNATGVAAMMESVAALNRLIESGKLPRPRRSIRVLIMGEMYASMHYVQTHPERMRNTLAAICLDSPAASYDLPGTAYTWHLNPRVSSSFTDAFILKLAEEYFAGSRPVAAGAFTPGTDTYLADPMIGIPTVWPYSGTGVHSHHMSADVPSTVDVRSLRDLAVLDAAFLYFIAGAGPDQARWLAQISAERGRALLTKDGSPENRAALKRAVHSVRKLADVDVSPLEQSLGGSPPSSGQSEKPGWIVKRKRFGTLPLDDLPVEQREGFPSGAWSLPHILALYWCDGKRPVSEVIRLTEAELGPQKIDFPAYFRFLARRGYVDLIEP